MTNIKTQFKLTISATLAALASAGVVRGQEAAVEDVKLKVEYTLIYPNEKAPETVKPEEENPFVALADLNAKEDVGNSEENKVKEIILAMQVVGASPRPQGYRVQLGDMILSEGTIVPPFLPDQTVQLRVNSITEEQIEFVWLEKQPTGLPPRTLLMPIKMKPVVRYAMPGQGRLMGASSKPINKPQVEEVVPKRAVTVEDEPVEEVKQSASAARKKSAADAVLDMFFNQGGAKVPEPK
mgnify:CR=1 FL=1